MDGAEGKTCCFIGHGQIDFDEAFLQTLKNLLKKLVEEEKVTQFLFGEDTPFERECRKAFQKASFSNVQEKVLDKKRAALGRINKYYQMLDCSDYAVFYYDDRLHSGKEFCLQKEGIAFAISYAYQKKRTGAKLTIINLHREI